MLGCKNFALLTHVDEVLQHYYFLLQHKETHFVEFQRSCAISSELQAVETLRVDAFFLWCHHITGKGFA
jgi:hypothetical protein